MKLGMYVRLLGLNGILGLAGLYGDSAILSAAEPAPVAKAAAAPPSEAEQLAEVKNFTPEIRQLLEKHCIACHGADAQEGGVDFAPIQDHHQVQAQRRLWQRAVRRIERNEMPPEGEPPLSAAEKQRLSKWMHTAADYVDSDPARRDPGPSVLRRLTRKEYQNTVRDLLYLPDGVVNSLGLPEDQPGDGFENQAARLSVAPAIIERYFEVADRVIDKVYGQDWYAKGTRDKLLKPAPNDKLPEAEAARQIIAKLLRRAYRRPPSDADVTRMLGFYERARAAGQSFPDAFKAVMKPVLVSPLFLFRVEHDPIRTGTAVGVNVDDHELAVRLAYFLWSTMPDDELYQVAESGQLSNPEVLAAQVQRMLKAKPAQTLTQNFAEPWLQLKGLANARPSQEFFPEFNSQLKQAMRDEVVAFFDAVRNEDLSLLTLLDADFTFVNAALAKHYGLAEVKGDKPQRVTLTPDQHRGGLLGMAGILTLTSHTFRTSPTQRGKYVLEVLLGDPPPPPPANAGMLKEEPPGKGKPKEIKTFKEQLAAHATQASCAGCHRKIDPLGFALDNYNAVGKWRESTSEQPLDTAGQLPTGEQVNGAADLKRVLLDRKEEFARNVVERMLVYALGRELDPVTDEPTVREITKKLQQSDYRFSVLMTELVNSVPFRQRRPATEISAN